MMRAVSRFSCLAGLSCLSFAAANTPPLGKPDAREPFPSRASEVLDGASGHHMLVLRPDPTRQFHLLLVRPDPNVDFHLELVAPGQVRVSPPR